MKLLFTHPFFCMLNSCLLPVPASMSVPSFQKLNLLIWGRLEAGEAGQGAGHQGLCSGGLQAAVWLWTAGEGSQGWGTVGWGWGRGWSYVARRVCQVMGRARLESGGSAVWRLEGERLYHVGQVLLKPQEHFSCFCALKGGVGERRSFISVLVRGHCLPCVVGGARE